MRLHHRGWAALLAAVVIATGAAATTGTAEAATTLRSLADWAPSAEWAALVQEITGLKSRLGVDELLFELLNRTRYLEGVPAQVTANVSRFAELVDRYCERRRDHSLSLFVDYLDLVLLSGVDEDVAREDDALEGQEDAVQVMTIHQAKGLEFEAVFVPAMVEGRLPQPHRRGDLDLPVQLAEPQIGEVAWMAVTVEVHDHGGITPMAFRTGLKGGVQSRPFSMA